MQFEFDPGKDAANLAKHGVSMMFASAIMADPNAVTYDVSREQDGEERLKTLGKVRGRLWAVVYTRRGEACRLISVRKGNSDEEKIYGSVHL